MFDTPEELAREAEAVANEIGNDADEALKGITSTVDQDIKEFIG